MNKEKNKEKTFGMNLEIEDKKIVSDADQMGLLYKEAKEKLLEYIDSEGYRVTYGPKLIPIEDEEDKFKVEARAVPIKEGE